MSDIKFTANGVLFFPDLGKDNQVTGPFPGLNLSAKKKVKDVEFVLSVPTAKAAKDKTLSGTVLSLRGTHKDLETKASIDLGTKFKTAGALYKKKFDRPGRSLDLEVLWREKGSETQVGAVYKHDKLKRISGKYDINKQLGIVALGLEKDGFSLIPELKYDVQAQTTHPILAVSQKKGANTLKASYDIDAQSAALQLDHKGFKVIAKSSITHKDGFSAKPPSVWLSFSKDLEFGSSGPTRQHPDSLESALNKSGKRLVDIENARQGPLDERLKAIDAVSLEKKRDLTVSAIRKNREGNKGTRSRHD